MTVAELLGAAGGLSSVAWAARSFITARQERRRSGAEADESEMNTALAPLEKLITAQDGLIKNLTARITGLENQLDAERKAHEKQIAEMQVDIDVLHRRVQTLLAS